MKTNNMHYLLSEIAEIIGATLVGEDMVVSNVCFDSRALLNDKESLFAAIKGKAHNGHDYIEEMINSGVMAFMVEKDFKIPNSNASFIVTDGTIDALQRWAAEYRKRLPSRVVAITGSNGKTVVKEFFAQLWNGGNLFRSPRSYNSQLGVALSLLMAQQDDSVVFIEAGISETGEMERLAKMVSPEVMVITNIGGAHSENFDSIEQKLSEKLLLGQGSKKIVYCANQEKLSSAINERFPKDRLFSWGANADCDLQLIWEKIIDNNTHLILAHKSKRYSVKINFIDNASIENFITTIAIYAAMDYPIDQVISNCSRLQSVAMRLELKEGAHGEKILNDSYNSDLNSLAIAIDYLEKIASDMPKIIILSDIYQSCLDDNLLYEKVSKMVGDKGISTFIGIGKNIHNNKELFVDHAKFFLSTEDFLAHADKLDFRDSAILIKGSRAFGFERISRVFEKQIHSTVLEVNLDTLIENLNHYRNLLAPNVKIMAMVKAFSYGTGSTEIARLLEREGVDMLAVAYADEGIVLRQTGVTLPIIVLNSDPSGFAKMIEHNLEPEIYSLSSLDNFINELQKVGINRYGIHLKIDTGMHRLGFSTSEIDSLINVITKHNSIEVKSIFSHLAASEDPTQDNFTKTQVTRLTEVATKIKEAIHKKDIIVHICNSAAISRHRDAHFDMVRLGIGLYEERADKSVVSLKSIIVQIKSIAKGETIGYNRKATAQRDMVIGIIAVGYADGLSRSLSCGKWSVRHKNGYAPIVGNICMDTSMIDITDIKDVKEGDSVTIFGDNHSIKEMAKILSTIDYEILTSISSRVKRVYIKE